MFGIAMAVITGTAVTGCPVSAPDTAVTEVGGVF